MKKPWIANSPCIILSLKTWNIDNEDKTLDTVVWLTREGSHLPQQFLPGLPVLPLEFLPKPGHQGPGQSLLTVVLGKAQKHRVLGQTEQRGDSAGPPGSEKLLEDHPLLDCSKGPELLKGLSLSLLPTIQYEDKYWNSVIITISKVYLAMVSQNFPALF